MTKAGADEGLVERLLAFERLVSGGGDQVGPIREAISRMTLLEAALKDVIDPLGYLRRTAEAEGNKLGPMAYSIANDLGFVRQIAKDALANLHQNGRTPLKRGPNGIKEHPASNPSETSK